MMKRKRNNMSLAKDTTRRGSLRQSVMKTKTKKSNNQMLKEEEL
jgi:hypothetical protein